MSDTQTLPPARKLAATNKAHVPNESAAYRTARNALLAEEIELRRHIERVAGQRRALPQGGEIPCDFELVSETGPIRFSSLFGDKDTLMVYSMMYGPGRKAPCPMCTSFLSVWNGIAVNLRERCAIAVTARSSMERLIEYQKQRGFDDLRFVSDTSGDYTRTYVSPVFEKKLDHGKIAALGGRVERGPTAVLTGVDRGAMCYERLHQFEIAARDGGMQRHV